MIAEKDVRERIRIVLSNKKVSVNALSKKTGINQTTLNPQLNGTSKLSCTSLFSFIDLFDDISAEWLLRGDGTMFKNENTGNQVNVGTMTGGNAVAGGNVEVAAEERFDFMELLREREARIAELTEDKKRLNALVDLLMKK